MKSSGHSQSKMCTFSMLSRYAQIVTPPLVWTPILGALARDRDGPVQEM